MAAEALVSVILEQLIKIVIKEVGLVACAGREVENLKRKLGKIQAVLKDAEEKQRKDEAVSVWLDDLKEASYDIDDVLDEWNTKMMKLQIERVRHASIFKKKMKEMNERLNIIDREKDSYNLNEVTSKNIHKPHGHERITTSFVNVSDIYGREKEKGILVSKLLSKSNEGEKGLHIISIVGMGGVGKTTLAQFAYNDHEIIESFEKKIWVCVSNPFDEFRIAKAILETLTGKASKLGELQALYESIVKSIEGKNFLLVLDDVWTENYDEWKSLFNCLGNGDPHGSKIIVTTRKEIVARVIGTKDIIPLEELSEDVCWSLFTSIAFLDKSVTECKNLEEVGRKIVGKCKGLPLAIKTIGSLLRFKKTIDEWQRNLNSEMWNLEEFKETIFPALFLSYDDLPYMIKRCFSYCAIFPKDYEMRKDELIQLWMAQSYLGNEEMEVDGEEYFNYLAIRSLFQDFEKDEENNIIGCKMHDILHDFAQSLTKNECFALEFYDSKEPISTSTLHAKARHSSVYFGKYASFPESILKAKRLRSILLIDDRYYYNWDVEDNKLFDELTCLRAFSLYHTSMEKISRKIGKLIHLRYLSLSVCEKLKELPETLCDLYNLQTLDISACYNIEKLPQGIGKLINLRHLLNSGCDSLISMPKGIERLTCLRTLELVIVGCEGSWVDCLKNLNNLRGSLKIIGLGNVMNVDEVKRAQVLYDKKYLKDLILDFSEVDNDAGSSMNERDEDVLECLQPPSNLEKLIIWNYGGKTLFPNWMTLLIKLRVLVIVNCINCDRLPPLGKLSSLEELYILGMENVEIVSNEFLGIENDPTRPSSSSIVAFPKLKRLEFQCLRIWKEWYYKIPKREEEEEKDDFPRIMPCLTSLIINHCYQLKELPDFLFHITTLEKLEIDYSSILEERCRKETGDYWKNIKHIKNIRINYKDVKRDGVELLL